MGRENILEMRGISKHFPGVQALKDVSLVVRKGTVHALMGENGAGKSTLMKTLIGLYKPDAGVIYFNGKERSFKSVHESIQAGISMIHQELNPVPYMNVGENIFLGKEPCYPNSFLVNHREMERQTDELLSRLEIQVNPRQLMKNLSASYIQMVEIAKALSYDAKLIIMDEPTSAITEYEVEHLFKTIHWLRENNISIIYISHKIDEIFKIADYITVLRDGEVVGTGEVGEFTKETLIHMMVGRNLNQLFPKEEVEIGETVLEVKNLSLPGKFENINFSARKGEITGLAGLMGAGRTEIVESIFGLYPEVKGEIYLNGRRAEIRNPQDAVKLGIGLLTEDRKQSGLFLPLSVKDNIAIVNINKYIKKGLLDHREIQKDCEKYIDFLQIKTPSLNQAVNYLSGGNQQKVLLARWLLVNCEVLILDEPTRGIDVGAKSEIHKLMSALAKQGKAIIMVSSELPEILGMSDKILVIYRGHVQGELSREKATQEKIMLLASGEKQYEEVQL